MYGMDVGWFRNMDDGWQCDQVTTLDDQEGVHYHIIVVRCGNVRIYMVTWAYVYCSAAQCNSSICTDVTRQSSDIR